MSPSDARRALRGLVRVFAVQWWSRCGPLAALACCGAFLVVARQSDARPLLRQEISRLERGQIITRYWKLEGSGVGTGLAIGVIDAAPARTFEVITDVDRYEQFMNRVVESRVTRRDGDTYYFYYKIDMPWPLSDQWFITKNFNHTDKKGGVLTRRWTLHKGSFARNDGYWRVRAWSGGRSLATYSVVLQPKSAMPQSVINFVTKKSLPRAITQLRDRIAQLQRSKRRD